MNHLLGFLNRYKLLIIKSALPLSLILLIGFAFLLIGYNLQEAARGLEERYALEIFLKGDATPADIDTLAYFLKHQPSYDHLQVISQADAAQRMTAILGEDLVEVLGYNPLPMSIVFYPIDSYKNRTYLEILRQQAEAMHFVEKGVFAGEWLQELEQFNSLFIKITSAFLLLVLLAYLLLFHLILNHLWLKHRIIAGKLYLLGMSRLRLRTPVYIWALIAALISSLLGLIILGIAANFVSDNFIAVKFFEPRQVIAIIITFTAISLLITIFKRMKIPSYE